jgi:hypothetical protein
MCSGIASIAGHQTQLLESSTLFIRAKKKEKGIKDQDSWLNISQIIVLILIVGELYWGFGLGVVFSLCTSSFVSEILSCSFLPVDVG